MQQRVVTLLSDFGLKDSYVSEMKAVILSEFPQAKIIDITHQIDRFNVRMGAFQLACATPYFPKGTVHIAVVDPGVGTKRRPIIVETTRSHLVGPDNGVLILAALKEGIEHVYVIENPRCMLPKVSNTFHGRDVFAPAAAHLASGRAATEFGEEIQNYEVPAFSEPSVDKGVISGEILNVDRFGNIITNIPSGHLAKLPLHENVRLKAIIGNETTVLKFCSSYGSVPIGGFLAIVGSHDFLEISVNQGNAAKRFNVEGGESISVGLNYG